MLAVELIRKKRDHQTLTRSEIDFLIDGVSGGTIPDYQVSALLMAIYLNGMADEELGYWSNAMLHSGEVLDLSHIKNPKIDKHSTGGVGDKISIPLSPAAAAAGLTVPMIAGRGLGHTGGTLDKLEAIPGYRCGLTKGEFIKAMETVGSVIAGQTGEIAPADKRLYALRDVTGTIESIPLIASSIMSKKLAEGIDGLVLDCKVGTGAFMKDIGQARSLATAIRAIGHASNTKVTVAITDMNEPIGEFVGNALEIQESIEVLQGAGPSDTRELTVELGAEMLLCAGRANTREEAVQTMERVLDDGSALAKFRQVIEVHGGNPAVCDDISLLPQAQSKTEINAPESGYIEAIHSAEVGMAALFLGAGRRKKEDNIDFATGFRVLKRKGDPVQKGEPLAVAYHNNTGFDAAAERLVNAFTISQEKPSSLQSRIIEVIR